jgi:pyruvate ferredoxin oxidoreductase gamma subunit/2-oxoisovalerate ferredoxin oxidoreductase gamma subunit
MSDYCEIDNLQSFSPLINSLINKMLSDRIGICSGTVIAPVAGAGGISFCRIEGKLVEITIYGRGGQGTVIASEILASALFKENKYVQAFPNFGAERRGAPVTAFLRFDTEPIDLRCQIYRPDHMIVLDGTLLQNQQAFSSLKPGGWIIANLPLEPPANGFLKDFRVAYLNADQLSTDHHLAARGSTVVNTIILGAFAKATGLVSLQSVLESIAEFVPQKKEDNRQACQQAYETVRVRKQT